MRFSLRNWIVFSACAPLLLICSCEKHHLGEQPEVQKEGVVAQAGVEAASPAVVSPTPLAKPTPVEFFPTKP